MAVILLVLLPLLGTRHCYACYLTVILQSLRYQRLYPKLSPSGTRKSADDSLECFSTKVPMSTTAEAKRYSELPGCLICLSWTCCLNVVRMSRLSVEPSPQL